MRRRPTKRFDDVVARVQGLLESECVITAGQDHLGAVANEHHLAKLLARFAVDDVDQKSILPSHGDGLRTQNIKTQTVIVFHPLAREDFQRTCLRKNIGTNGERRLNSAVEFRRFIKGYDGRCLRRCETLCPV